MVHVSVGVEFGYWVGHLITVHERVTIVGCVSLAAVTKHDLSVAGPNDPVHSTEVADLTRVVVADNRCLGCCESDHVPVSLSKNVPTC